MKPEKSLTTEYIQFSKRITRWGMALVTIMLILCFVLIAIFQISAELAQTVAHLYSAYITIMGITIGAYQGNSSLEKWTKAKYKYEELLKQEEEEAKPEEEELG